MELNSVCEFTELQGQKCSSAWCGVQREKPKMDGALQSIFLEKGGLVAGHLRRDITRGR